MECLAGIRRIGSARLKKITSIASHVALIIVLAGACVSPLAAEDALPDAYRSAKSALEAGDAAKAAAILMLRLPDAKGETSRALSACVKSFLV